LLHGVPGLGDGFRLVVGAEPILQVHYDEAFDLAPVGEGQGAGNDLEDQDEQEQEEEYKKHARALLDGTAAAQESDDHDDDTACDQEVAGAQEGEGGEDGGEVVQLEVDVDAHRQNDDASNKEDEVEDKHKDLNDPSTSFYGHFDCVVMLLSS